MSEKEHNCECGHEGCDCEENEQNIVDVVWEDGTVVKCEVYDVIDFEEKTYALLLPQGEDEDDEDSEVIVMEYVEEGDEGYFQNIDDEAEFNKVCAYIESLEYDEEE